MPTFCRCFWSCKHSWRSHRRQEADIPGVDIEVWVDLEAVVEASWPCRNRAAIKDGRWSRHGPWIFQWESRIGHGYQHVFPLPEAIVAFTKTSPLWDAVYFPHENADRHRENSDIYWHMVSPILWNIFHGNLLTFSGTYCSGKYVDINSDIKFRDGSGKFHVKFIPYVLTGILI